MNFKIEKFLKIRTIIFLLVTLMLFYTGCASNTKAIKETKEDTTESFEQKLITDISTTEDSGSSNVWIKGDSTLTYTSVKQPFPLGVLLYFPETAIDNIDTTYTPASDIVNSIKASELTTKGHTTQIEILIKQDIPYEVTREDTGIKISFKKVSVVSASSDQEPIEEESVQEEKSTEKTIAPASMLESVDTEKLEKSINISINVDGVIKDYKSLTVDNPARIVFDIFNVTSPYKAEQSVPVDSKWVKRIRHYGYPDHVRVVLDTTTEYLSAFSANPVDKGLLIRVGEYTEQPKPSEQEALRAEASNPDNPEPQVKKSNSAWINRIDFSSEDDGKSTIIIGTTTPVKYDIKKIHDKKILLKLYNARLPDYRQRPLITTRFNSAIDRIIPFQMPAMKDSSLVAIELRESVPYFAEQTDDLLMLHFEASSIPPKTLDEAKLPDWKKVVAQSVVEREKEEIEAVKKITPEAELGQYTGKKIALNFYDADIKNVFRILMDVSGKNFVIDKDVSGKVTLSLDKPVPWDQVLDLVLKMNRLKMVYEGDIVRIVTNKTYMAEQKEKRAKKDEEQKMKKVEKELEPLITEYIPINYADASADVMPHIVLSPRGQKTVDARNNQIIITDVTEKIKQAKAIANQIDKVTPQVIIEARIVEASTTFSRDLGTEWGITGGPIDNNKLGGDLTLDMFAINPPASTLGTIGVQFSRLAGNQFSLIDLRIRASESNGEVKIISAPKVLALDNTPAHIKQGLAYPYNKLDADGNTTTEWKDIALELEVTPHITPDDRVSMKLTVKNNERGAIINNQTSFTTKEASTELLVDDGDTIVIGGIRKTRKDWSESGVPGLMKVPILGWFFKNQTVSDDLEELLIFITPRIIKLEHHAM